MGKTTQKELLLQAELLGTKFDKNGKRVDTGLIGQGFFATKTSDRFKAGKPDLRLARLDLGQMDVELKYLVDELSPSLSVHNGLTKLQWLKIKEMNEHGIPAVCLVYAEKDDYFYVTTLLYDTLPPVEHRVKSQGKGKVIDGVELFATARSYLSDGSNAAKGQGLQPVLSKPRPSGLRGVNGTQSGKTKGKDTGDTF